MRTEKRKEEKREEEKEGRKGIRKRMDEGIGKENFLSLYCYIIS